MADLIYATNVSLDGYIEDADGRFDWLPGDDDVFAAHTALMRSAGTLFYGRHLYETMSVWETEPSLAGRSPAAAEFAAAWRATAKVVYSTSLTAPSTANTRIERAFDPDRIRALKAGAGREILIGGADLAAQAFAARLIDEVQLYVLPLVIGGGKPGLPTGMRVDLELIDQRRFDSGVVLLRYRPRR
ncbi:dihydrofolate reductase family protein [Tsukamurella ocularis]|uniref:dihydrofolate reductase family protein n=1 Tax=Tsukamurella ocularis TaxID=1970234 RepID=UPI0039EF807D